MLSIGGRVTMLKSVITSLTVYFLYMFKILISIKDELDGIQLRFLWGGLSSTRKVHWVDWKSVL